MVKSTALVLVSVCVGWVFRGIYADETTLSINQKREKLSDFECKEVSPDIIEKTIEKEVIKYVPKTKIVYREKKEEDNSTDPFLIALEQKKFYKAMEYYEDADEEKHSIYQKALLGYFKEEKVSRPFEIISQIGYFIEIEANNKTFIFLLARFYKERGNFIKAIETLIEFSFVASSEDMSVLKNKIKSFSMTYIELLVKRDDYKNAIDFLQTQINRGVLSQFFSFELATVYLKLKKYLESKELLEVLKESSIYKERAIALLNYIDEKLAEKEEYPVQIPLMRSGTHFVVKAYINQLEVLLLLDTGASITTVDYELVSNLDVLEKDVVFSTANGKIYSSIFNADNFTIGSLTLKNFQISGGISSGGRIKGLLGMNFLGRYKFKIDQKEAILFLGQKY